MEKSFRARTVSKSTSKSVPVRGAKSATNSSVAGGSAADSAVESKYPEIHATLRSHFGLEMNDMQVLHAVNAVQNIKSRKWLMKEIKDDCDDTIVRDNLIDAIVMDIAGPEWTWPMNMHGEEYSERFILSFAKGCRDKGVKWNWAPSPAKLKKLEGKYKPQSVKVWISALIPREGADCYKGVRISTYASETDAYEDLHEWLRSEDVGISKPFKSIARTAKLLNESTDIISWYVEMEEFVPK